MSIEQYLARHAEPEARDLPDLGRHYRRVICIPAYDERPDFLERIFARTGRDAGLLTVVVVNAPTDADAAARSRSRVLLEHLASDSDHLLVVDRVSKPVPRRQGVGLARKIGADICCALIARGTVNSPFIYLTDADVLLPHDYFATPLSEKSVTLFPFTHRASDPVLQLKATLYELHLHHYVDGLIRAGSPYAYQALGSTMVTDVATYASVRGIPKRNAGEDFYFLNKAVKVAPVISLVEPEMEIAARPSTRVPFGTGPALAKIPDDQEHYASYAPEVFEHLRILLEQLKEYGLYGRPLDDKSLDAKAASSVWIDELGWQDFARSVSVQHPPGPRRLRSVLEWFDGFRTLRFVHIASAEHPNTPLLATLRQRLQLPEAAPAELLLALRPREMRRLSLTIRPEPHRQ